MRNLGLVASYLLHGNWRSVDKLWQSASAPERTTSLSTKKTDSLATDSETDSVEADFAWSNDIDWVQMVADQLAIDADILWAEVGSNGSLAAVAGRSGKDVDELVTVIYTAEKNAVDDARAVGTLSSQDAQGYMANLEADIRAYLIESSYGTTVDWNAITATELGMSKTALLNALTDQTIPDLAQVQGVHLQRIRQAIITAEVIELRTTRRFGESDAVSILSEAIDWLDEYLDAQAESPSSNPEPDSPSGLLADYLVGDEDLLIVALDGNVLYNSSEKSHGTQVSSAMLAQGVPLYKAPTDEQIATVLITAGIGNYSSQQQAFLEGMTYSLLLSSGIAALVALLVAFLVARQVTAPVRALTTAAQQIADGQTGAHLPVVANDELGQMSAAFNQMATALETQRELRQRLVNDLAHELGTPLSVLQLEMQALRDGLQTPEEAFEQVQEEIELLQNLINDLDNLESTEHGQLSLQREPIDLVALAQRAVKRWQAKAENNKIFLSLTAPDDLLPLIDADAARLTQVLGILLDNGLRHMTTGDTITVNCQMTMLSSLDLPIFYAPAVPSDDFWLIVTVNDSGIPAADLPYLFERFYRADNSRNRRSGGRGLGLAIAQQIITAHGGHIWAQSVEGQGSTFGFSLPITELE